MQQLNSGKCVGGPLDGVTVSLASHRFKAPVNEGAHLGLFDPETLSKERVVIRHYEYVWNEQINQWEVLDA